MQNLVSLGTIAKVDHLSARVRVDINGRVTGWLPVPGQIGRNFRAWTPLREGTQVLLCCPSGDPGNAIIAQILYTDALAPPAAAGELDVIEFDDGTTLRYDSGARRLEVTSAGAITIHAAGPIQIEAARVEVTSAEDIELRAARDLTLRAPRTLWLRSPDIREVPA